MNCFYHPNAKGVYRCEKCDRAICDEDKKEIFLDNKGLEVTNATSGIIKTYCFICYLDANSLHLSKKKLESNQLILFISMFFIFLPTFFLVYSLIDSPEFSKSNAQSLAFLFIPIYFIIREIVVLHKITAEIRRYQIRKVDFYNTLSSKIKDRIS